MMKYFVVVVALIGCRMLAAEDFPDAPSPQETVRPLALGISFAERYTIRGRMRLDELPGLFANYRFDHNRFNANVAVSRSTKADAYSVTGTLSMSLVSLGKLRR